MWCTVLVLSLYLRFKLNLLRLSRVLKQWLQSWRTVLVAVHMILNFEWALLDLLRLLLDANIIFHGVAACSLLFWGFLWWKWLRGILTPLWSAIRLVPTLLALVLLRSAFVKVVMLTLLLIALALQTDATVRVAKIEVTIYEFQWVKPWRVIDFGHFFLLFFNLLLLWQIFVINVFVKQTVDFALYIEIVDGKWWEFAVAIGLRRLDMTWLLDLNFDKLLRLTLRFWSMLLPHFICLFDFVCQFTILRLIILNNLMWLNGRIISVI